MTTRIHKLNVVVITSAALLLLTITSAQAATIIEDDVEGNGDKSAITGKITKAWAGWNGAIRAGDRFGQYGPLSAGMNADNDLGLGGTAIEVANGALVYKDDTSLVSVTYGGLTQVGTYTISLQMHQFAIRRQIHTVRQFKFAGVAAASASSTPPAKLASGLTTPGKDADEVIVLTYNVATAGKPLRLTIAPNGSGGSWGIDHVQIDFVARAKDSLGIALLAAKDSPLKKGELIAFFGDSITAAGAGKGGYCRLINNAITANRPKLEVNAIYAGISGHKVPNLQGRLDRDVLSKKPTVVFIYIGINDVWHSQNGQGTPKDKYEAGLRDLIAKITATGATVVLATPSVIGEVPDGSNKLDSMLEEYAAISRKVAADTKTEMCDLRKAFIEHLKKNNPKKEHRGILTSDGVHLNPAGNRFVANLCAKAIVAALKKRNVIVSVPQVEGVEGQAAKKNPAVTPQCRIVEWWFARHAKKIGELSKGDIDLLMVGDSITHNFESVGAKVWKKYFEPLKAINLGFGGDRTQHVLWRLDHLPKLKKAPSGAVVMIGTNNICWGSDTPKQAAEGVQAIARKPNDIYPYTRILVLGVFPRRRQLEHAHRKQIIELNSYLPELLKDIENVTFKDIGPKFLDEKGLLSKEMMPDTTHPSEKGHEIWAKAIEPELKKMLGE